MFSCNSSNCLQPRVKKGYTNQVTPSQNSEPMAIVTYGVNLEEESQYFEIYQSGSAYLVKI